MMCWRRCRCRSASWGGEAINKPTHPPERPTSPVHHLGSLQLQLCSVGRLSDTGRYNLQSPDMIV
eukprot:scaffold2045_cov203-Alexandrium_tamarense.AAC.11